MTTLREAAQQALEAMEAAEFHAKRRTPDASIEVAVQPAITALRAALAEEALQRLTDAQQEIETALAEPTTEDSSAFEPVQEPVAWMVYTLDGKSVCVTDNPADFTDEYRVLPLFTAPPQRKEGT